MTTTMTAPLTDVVSGVGVRWFLYDIDGPRPCDMAAWCDGVHDPDDVECLADLNGLDHARVVAQARVGDDLVLEVSVGQWKALETSRLRDKDPSVWIFINPEAENQPHCLNVGHWRWAVSLAHVAHLNAADGLADAMERAAQLARRIDEVPR